MRLLELPAVLRAAGLIVHEWPGWRTHGSDAWGPVRGIICHGTGGRLSSTDSGEINVIAVTGSVTAPEVPIAQLYQSRSGEWTVIASGKATGVKTGTAGPLKGFSDGSVLQIEAQHNGSEPWTATQYWSYVRGVAALVGYLRVDVSMVVGHYEHQPTEKTDPWFDMNRFRADVRAVMRGQKVSFLAHDKANRVLLVASDGLSHLHLETEQDVEDVLHNAIAGRTDPIFGMEKAQGDASRWPEVLEEVANLNSIGVEVKRTPSTVPGVDVVALAKALFEQIAAVNFVPKSKINT